MKELAKTDICELVGNILERTAFLFMDPCEETLPLECRSYSHISFKSTGEEGDVFLAAEDGFLAELAGSMLGLEPSELNIDVEGVQALDELASVVGGEIILAIGGSETPYVLSLPSRLQSFPEPSPGKTTMRCRFESESGCMDLLIRRSAA